MSFKISTTKKLKKKKTLYMQKFRNNKSVFKVKRQFWQRFFYLCDRQNSNKAFAYMPDLEVKFFFRSSCTMLVVIIYVCVYICHATQMCENIFFGEYGQ